MYRWFGGYTFLWAVPRNKLSINGVSRHCLEHSVTPNLLNTSQDPLTKEHQLLESTPGFLVQFWADSGVDPFVLVYVDQERNQSNKLLSVCCPQIKVPLMWEFISFGYQDGYSWPQCLHRAGKIKLTNATEGENVRCCCVYWRCCCCRLRYRCAH